MSVIDIVRCFGLLTNPGGARGEGEELRPGPEHTGTRRCSSSSFCSYVISPTVCHTLIVNAKQNKKTLCGNTLIEQVARGCDGGKQR